MKTIKYDCRIETLDDKGNLHSFNDKPAIEWDDGDKRWYENGKVHRLEGPAYIAIYRNFIEHYYYKNNLLHRLLKPAFIRLDNGIKSHEAYYIKGKLHNPIGAAEIHYAPHYNFKREFYISGKLLSYDHFMKQLEERLNL